MVPGGMIMVGVRVAVGQLGHGVTVRVAVPVTPGVPTVTVPVGAGTGGVGVPATEPGQMPSFLYRQSK